MTKFSITIAIGVVLGLAAAGPSFAQSPPEIADYVQPSEPAPRLFDLKACAGSSTLGVGDTIEATHPGEALNERLATTGSMVCPPPEFDPDIRIPALSNPGHWGARPN